jgi:nucleoid DNA-binding protein
MKKPELAKNMARHAGVSRGEAADRLDCVVQEILTRLRRGQEADLPGLGRFTFGADGRVAFERDERTVR